MRLFRHKFLPFIPLIFAFSIFAQTPTPTPEKPETVYTEEIKLNISASDLQGNFATALKKEDLVIIEDGWLHQAESIEHIPATVLILLDTGGENRVAKDFKLTRTVARNLISRLKPDDRVAIIQYHDQVELIAEWTSDKSILYNALDKKMNFGRRSRFTEAMLKSVDYLEQSKTENRHLVLIGDGLDSLGDRERRTLALRNLTATNVNFHVLSYTGMEKKVTEQRRKSVSGGGKSAINLPPGAGNPTIVSGVPIATINMDRAMMRKIQERAEDLKQSEAQLIQLTEDTNGVFYLPENDEEMVMKTGSLAQNIDSQYVVTYMPKRPLNESRDGEVRTIEVMSRIDTIFIQAKRKLIVVNNKKD